MGGDRSVTQKGHHRRAHRRMTGLFFKHPTAAVLMLIFLLSLAGIPPTAGFIAKYYLFAAAIETHHNVLAIIAVLNAAISLYFYFRIVVSMFMRDATSGPVWHPPPVSASLWASPIVLSHWRSVSIPIRSSTLPGRPAPVSWASNGRKAQKEDKGHKTSVLCPVLFLCFLPVPKWFFSCLQSGSHSPYCL